MAKQTLGTTTITQVGIIVGDVEAKAKAWADILGLPVPPIVMTDPAEKAQTECRGRATPARAKLAFFKLGQVQLELIEPIGEPSTWREQLDEHGQSIHHIAFEVKGMKEKATLLGGKGIALVQRGEYTGGRYAYFDGSDKLGAILELLEND